MRRAVLLAATMAIVAVLAVGTASADPVNKNSEILTFDCGGEQVTVVTIFQSRGVQFNVVDTTGNFVLTRVDITETFTNPDTEEMVEEEFVETIGQGQREGLQGSLTTCDTTITFEDPVRGTVTVDFTFTGFFTPRQG